MSSKSSLKSVSPKVGDTGSSVSRPRRKADYSVRGNLKRWNGTDYCEFVPTGSRESNRTMIKQTGPSSFYKTEGQKESSYSIHINIDGSSADPVNESFEVFKFLTEGERKHEPKLSDEGQGRMLYDDGQRLQVWLDSEKHEVSILTRLDCSADIERQLLQMQASMNVTIARYRSDIINNSNK